MYLTVFSIIDLFFRFVVVGQLSVLLLTILREKPHFKSVIATGLIVCISAYLLLTAPIPNQHYGHLRGVLLFFTELMPYFLWCFAMALLQDNFHPKQWSGATRVFARTFAAIAIIIGLLWFIYFFGYRQGKGSFHQINHLIEFALLAHIIFIAIRDLRDDLVNSRRTMRILLMIFISVYLSFLLVLELSDASLRDSVTFSLINALWCCCCCSTFSWFYVNNKLQNEPLLEVNRGENDMLATTVPTIFQANYQALCQLMTDDVFKETNLTINRLAEKLALPEHQLRELINKHLGFRNFSDYLNSYRIPAACRELETIVKLRKPILTIALELGFGSIAAFNRAFKAKTGQTAKEYRQQFQK